MIVSGCSTGSFTSEMTPVRRTCKVQWGSTIEEKEVWIGIDRTAPAVVGMQPDRPPDYNGWFNHPVGLAFQGTDSLSGIASCSSLTFDSPEGHGVSVSGTCTDVAGHTKGGSFPINYDATPPPTPSVEAMPGDGTIDLTWTTSPDSQAEVTRVHAGEAPMVVYRGAGGAFTDRSLRNEQRYRYVVTLIDQAGNPAAAETSTVPTASKLLLPPQGSRVNVHNEDVSPPLLVWKAVRKATYYNVQVFRGERKVLSAWPKRAQLQLKRRWTFKGKQYSLRAGRYCWHVWPGYGKRSKHRYGKSLGKSCFRVTR
jgi:hypothetical protein